MDAPKVITLTPARARPKIKTTQRVLNQGLVLAVAANSDYRAVRLLQQPSHLGECRGGVEPVALQQSPKAPYAHESQWQLPSGEIFGSPRPSPAPMFSNLYQGPILNFVDVRSAGCLASQSTHRRNTVTLIQHENGAAEAASGRDHKREVRYELAAT